MWKKLKHVQKEIQLIVVWTGFGITVYESIPIIKFNWTGLAVLGAFLVYWSWKEIVQIRLLRFFKLPRCD